MKSSNPPTGKTVTFIAALSAVVTFTLVAFGAMALEAVATMVAWSWFIPPIIGLPKLNFQEALGLVLLVNFVLLPVVIPLNKMQVTIARYSKARATADLVAALKDFVDIDKKNREME